MFYLLKDVQLESLQLAPMKRKSQVELAADFGAKRFKTLCCFLILILIRLSCSDLYISLHNFYICIPIICIIMMVNGMRRKTKQSRGGQTL